MTPSTTSCRLATLRTRLSLLAVLLGGSITSTFAADPDGPWTQFLGPDRNGISNETGLLKSWPDGGPPIIWRAACGQGMSGPAIAGKQVLTLVQDSTDQSVLCLDRASGEQLWRTPIARAYGNSQGDGPRATPTVGERMVYALSGDGILVALDRATGRLAWSRNTVVELKGRIADYGMAGSPLLTPKLVITTVGAPGGTVAAWDRNTGELVWTAGRGSPAGYSSPVMRRFGGQDQLIVFHGAGVLGIVPETGRILWSYPFRTDYDCNIAVPVSVDEKLLISAGENQGSVLLEWKGQGAPVEVWKSSGVRSVLRSEWQTPVLLNGYLYGMDNVGSAGPVTHLTCVKATTGEVMWQKKRFGKGNLIAADGKLFISTMAGELVVVSADPDGYRELGRARYVGQTRQSPALADGRLYLRDGREIVCIDVRAAQ